MTEHSPTTWKEAINKSPGPASIKEAVILGVKGVCMGTADIIPGVSGGTIALITGIYQNLILAIQSANTEFIKHLLRFEIKEALSIIHIRFLFPLFLGIFTAIISLAHVMNHLLKTHPVPTWALFFGLISASIFIIGKNIEGWAGAGGLSFIAGTFFGYLVVGLIPVSTPETGWFIFLSGMIAICAMILPGLSGAFLLLILGKYEYITGALKNPFDMGNLIIICIFSLGCLLGITGFSRILSYFLKNYYNATIAMLTGLMCGSMKKIWPWKQVLEEQIIRGKVHVLREKNILPAEIDEMVIMACGLALTGLILVFLLDRISDHK